MRNEGGAASSSSSSSPPAGSWAVEGRGYEVGNGGGGEVGLGCLRPVSRAKTEEDGDGVVGGRGMDGGECDGGGGEVGESSDGVEALVMPVETFDE
jgi:hypothetical protein